MNIIRIISVICVFLIVSSALTGCTKFVTVTGLYKVGIGEKEVIKIEEDHIYPCRQPPISNTIVKDRCGIKHYTELEK